MTGLEFPLIGWIVLVASAVIVGISKTSIGGMGAVSVAGFAMFLPAKMSTAAVLLLLVIGDVIAVVTYRRNADWRMLARLLPSVLPGIALGALLMRHVDDETMLIIIASCLLVALLVQVVMRRRPPRPDQGEPRLPVTVGAGAAAGFTTMVANAAGPVMALYLLAARIDKLRFVGTNAWFFFLVNLSKVPFAAGLGLLPVSTLWLTLALLPALLAGAWIGRWLLHRLSQRWFERLTIAASVLATLALIARAVA